MRNFIIMDQWWNWLSDYPGAHITSWYDAWEWQTTPSSEFPQSPESLAVSLVGNDNQLDWNCGDPDVSQFNIYRTNVPNSNDIGDYSLIDMVPTGTDTFLDPLAGLGDATIWWYIVRSEDVYGNEELNVNAAREPPPPFTINLTGRNAGDWVFISFPTCVSGNVVTVLNDSLHGDGGTSWDVAKWYDPRDKSDPWKTHRIGGTHNDLPAIDNTMGVWLHLTTNGGDEMLTLGPSADLPDSSVQIPLYAGWNLVGYPSAADRVGGNLPPQADMVAVWTAESPYIEDLGPAAVMMSHGNAYWVRVTADCIWTVDP